MIRFVPKIEIHAASPVKSARPKTSRTTDVQLSNGSTLEAVAGDAVSLVTSSRPTDAQPMAEPLELSGEAPLKKPAAKRKNNLVPKKSKASAVEPGQTGGDLLMSLEA